jgi:Chalcone isomerase-like
LLNIPRVAVRALSQAHSLAQERFMSQLTRRLFIASLAWSGAAAAQAQGAPKAVVVEGFTFAAETQVGDATVVLNGVGLRAVAWIKGYAAGLYLTQRAKTVSAVLAAPGAKRLDIRLLLDAGMDEFSKSMRRGIGRNTSAAEAAKMSDRIAKFDANLLSIGSVKKKDVLTIDWVPGTGTVLSLNGKPRGEPIAGEDFYAAFLRIFIGNKVSDVELKAGLLGGPAG